jgi:hypothetical protein
MSFRRRLAFLVPVLAALAPGCDSTSTGEEITDPCSTADCSGAVGYFTKPSCCAYPHGQLTVDLKACSSGASESALFEAAALGVWFHRSLAALEEGVQLGFDLADDAEGVFVQLAQAPDTDALDLPFTHDPATGAYTASVVSTKKGSVRALFSFAEDYQAGKKGDPILPFLFRTSSYVKGAKIALGNGVATVSYDSEGPLVELLGFGPHPPNPFQLGIFDPTEMPKQTMDLRIADEEVGPGGFSGSFEAHLRHAIGQGVLEVSTEEVPIEFVNTSFGLAAGPKIEMLDAHLSAVDLGYGSKLRGSLRFRISGGVTPIDGAILYGTSGKSELQLLCGSGG